MGLNARLGGFILPSAGNKNLVVNSLAEWYYWIYILAASQKDWLKLANWQTDSAFFSWPKSPENDINHFMWVNL